MRITAEGGASEFTGISAPRTAGIRSQPRWLKIAYSSGTTVEEVWMLDDVLPAAK